MNKQIKEPNFRYIRNKLESYMDMPGCIRSVSSWETGQTWTMCFHLPSTDFVFDENARNVTEQALVELLLK